MTKYEGEDGTGLAMCLERTGTMIVWWQWGGNLRGRGKWADLKSRGEGQWKESADKKGGPAGLKPGPQQTTGLVGKRKLQPYAPHGAERTN